MLARGPVIACVLKSGGDFLPKHVYWLERMCRQHMPGWHFFCWTDMPVRGAARLRHDWPKWWAKMQIMKDLEDYEFPALVVDLDTVFLKPLEILSEHKDLPIFLRDPWKDGFRHPERLAAGFTYLPQWARAEIWSRWSKDPEDAMSRYNGDDQPWLHEMFSSSALRWQDHYLDQVVSYKVHVKGMGLQDDNRVVYFHGQPRPWDADEPWIPECK